MSDPNVMPDPNGTNSLHAPRAYQLEMLRESMKRNVVVTMDTGSGKTFVAVLRIQEEFKKPLSKGKLVWFLCPNVALSRQQHKVLSEQLSSLSTRLIVGDDGVDHWSSPTIWNPILANRDVIVSTYRVLFDALSHGFISIDRISLLVVDEAHHCHKKEPVNQIMQHFYHPAKAEGRYVPSVLGLTASPVTKTKTKDLFEIEKNLDAICRGPRISREELLTHTQPPELVLLPFHSQPQDDRSLVVSSLQIKYDQLDMKDDPEVIRLIRDQHPHDSRDFLVAVEQRKTFVCGQLRSVISNIEELEVGLGIWASRRYMTLWHAELKKKLATVQAVNSQRKQELRLLSRLLKELHTPFETEPLPPAPQAISDKVKTLMRLLVLEMKVPSAACIVFVKTRVMVSFLASLLKVYGETKDVLRVGTFVGQSKYDQRLQEIGDGIPMFDDTDSIHHLRTGEKNIIICTNACEEGIDISACNLVVCFDDPRNLKSFIQRRGRARAKNSKYIILHPVGDTGLVVELRAREEEMKQMYLNDMRQLQELDRLERDERGYREMVVPETGAKLTLGDAVAHLENFCNKLPAAQFAARNPLFTYQEVEPGRHVCTVDLPNSMTPELRTFKSSRPWRTEKLAKKDAAFEAYSKLRNVGLVNKHLLPEPDIEASEILVEVDKRDHLVEILLQTDPMLLLAHIWNDQSDLFFYSVHVSLSRDDGMQTDTENNEIAGDMKLGFPVKFHKIQPLVIYWDKDTTWTFEIVPHLQHQMVPLDSSLVALQKATTSLLSSVFGSRMEHEAHESISWPILVFPDESSRSLTAEMYSIREEIEAILSREERSDFVLKQKGSSGMPFEYFRQEYHDVWVQGEDERQPRLCAVCKTITNRYDFLHPVIQGQGSEPIEKYRPMNSLVVERTPVKVVRFATLIPTIAHHIGRSVLADDFITRILANARTPLGRFALDRIDLVLEALTTTSAREPQNYQRLEFLGDAILGFYAASSLTATNLTWHPGFLAKGKDHLVNNARLAQSAIRLNLGPYIMAESFTSLKWKPRTNAELLAQSADGTRRLMSTKTLADVIESLIGAALKQGIDERQEGSHGYPPNVLAVLKYLHPYKNWMQPEKSVKLMRDNVDVQVSLPPHFQPLETLIGYQFQHPALLLEALTHPSDQSSGSMRNYQRLEFLGDAVLQSLVTQYLFDHNANLPVGEMSILRTAVVNNQCLAFLAMTQMSVPVVRHEPVKSDQTRGSKPNYTTVEHEDRKFLHDFLLHGPSHSFAEARKNALERLQRWQAEISRQLFGGEGAGENRYPWTALASFAPEKMFSDIVEAVIAAIYVDSGGDESQCSRYLDRLGVWRILERAINDPTFVVMQPKQELGIVAVQHKVVYAPARNESCTEYTCSVSVGGMPVGAGFGRQRAEVETLAAADALRKIAELKDQGTWPDVLREFAVSDEDEEIDVDDGTGDEAVDEPDGMTAHDMSTEETDETADEITSW